MQNQALNAEFGALSPEEALKKLRSQVRFHVKKIMKNKDHKQKSFDIEEAVSLVQKSIEDEIAPSSLR